MLTVLILTILTGVAAPASAPAPPAPPNPFRVEWRDNKVVIHTDAAFDFDELPRAASIQVQQARENVLHVLRQTIREPGEFERRFNSDGRRALRKLGRLPQDVVNVVLGEMVDKRFEREGWSAGDEFPVDAAMELSEEDLRRLERAAEKQAKAAEFEARVAESERGKRAARRSEQGSALAGIASIAVAYIFLRGFVERTAPPPGAG